MEIFPKRQNTGRTAEIGLNIVSTIFNDYFGWVFRRTHQEHDFGVDAFIDFVSPEGAVTGQFIAAQIKTGKSYLSNNGSMHWYRDTKEHLNYFLNLPTPLLLIICDPETRECYWSVLDKGKIDFQESGWRHPIPKNKMLSMDGMAEIKNLFGGIQDYVSDFEMDNKFLGNIQNNSLIQYSIPREDIETLNTKKLKDFISRITRNEKINIAVQGKLYISTYGYESDTREVHQIDAVRKWAKQARADIDDWYLCVGNEPRFSTLLWIATCTCGFKSKLTRKRDGTMTYLVHNDPNKLLEFIDECYGGLNKASDKWGWSIKYNYEISHEIHKELFPKHPFPKFRE